MVTARSAVSASTVHKVWPWPMSSTSGPGPSCIALLLNTFRIHNPSRRNSSVLAVRRPRREGLASRASPANAGRHQGVRPAGVAAAQHVGSRLEVKGRCSRSTRVRRECSQNWLPTGAKRMAWPAGAFYSRTCRGQRAMPGTIRRIVELGPNEPGAVGGTPEVRPGRPSPSVEAP